MEIIFDDSFRFLANLQKQEDEIQTRISSLGSVILEKNIRLAISPDVRTEFENYKRTVKKEDKRKIFQDVQTNSRFNDDDRDWFLDQIETYSKTGGGRGWTPESDDLQGSMIQESNVTQEAGTDIGQALEEKEAVLAQLRNRGFDDQTINNILVLFMEKASLPFAETVRILDWCIQESIKARVNTIDVIEFFAYHYIEKRMESRTKFIIEQATKIQGANPTINIFNLLKNAAIGNQTEVSKLILIKDPDERLAVNNLIALAQSMLPEQNTEVRRHMQRARDAVHTVQEKILIQKSLVNMMMKEGMDSELQQNIAGMSDIFKFLMTQPLFRGLKQVYYDLQASKIVLNTLGSMLVDTEPINVRVSPREESVNPQSGTYPYQQKPQRLSSTQSNFRPLKKNSLRIAQTPNVGVTPGVSNPIMGSTPTAPPNLTPNLQGPVLSTPADKFGSMTMAPDSASQLEASREFIRSAGGTLLEAQKQIEAAAAKMGPAVEFVVKLIGRAFTGFIDLIQTGAANIWKALEDLFNSIIQSIKDNANKILDLAVKFFSRSSQKPDSTKFNTLDPGTAESLGNNNVGASFLEKNIKVGQYKPQTGSENFSKQKWAAGIGTVVTLVVAFLGSQALSKGFAAIAGKLGGAATAGNPFSALSSSNLFADIVNLFMPIIEYIKSAFIEIILEFNKNTSLLAPTSDRYYNRSRRTLSAEGIRRLYNAQQVMIALGISNEESMAIARAQKQRIENMATVRTQNEILQKNLDQTVYLGGKSDVAPSGVPADLQNKINIFLKFVKSVQDANQAEYLILKKGIDRVHSKLDPAQKLQAQNLLTEIRNDIANLQNLIAEYSSSAIVLDHLQRKRKLMMKIGPTLKRLEALESLGISKASLITGNNGVFQQLSRIRHEEASALQKLRKEYMEKLALLNNPDIAQKQFVYPTDTRAITLPAPPLPPTAPTSV